MIKYKFVLKKDELTSQINKSITLIKISLNKERKKI